MISIGGQHKLLLDVARRLKKKITVYAIGGTAMMFLGMKNATRDIDLVFENIKEREIFIKTIESLGYSKMNSIEVYGAKKNHPEMFTRGDERFDLFVKDVIDFVFSESMQNRANKTYQFEKNLILKIADPQDIILMKCATDRLKDLDDARAIINTIKIDWNLLIEEAKNQVSLGKDRAVFDLGFFLESLKKKMKIKVPQEILDELFKFAEQQAKERHKNGS